MSNPINEAYFIGKAITEIVGEKIEDNLTNVLSDLGKFDAETRQRLQEFAQEVQERAKINQKNPDVGSETVTVKADITVDPQELLDELRHEIARAKTQLTSYRQNNQ